MWCIPCGQHNKYEEKSMATKHLQSSEHVHPDIHTMMDVIKFWESGLPVL